MSKETPEIFTYENNMLRYEFRNNDFTNDLYKDLLKSHCNEIHIATCYLHK